MLEEDKQLNHVDGVSPAPCWMVDAGKRRSGRRFPPTRIDFPRWVPGQPLSSSGHLERRDRIGDEAVASSSTDGRALCDELTRRPPGRPYDAMHDSRRAQTDRWADGREDQMRPLGDCVAARTTGTINKQSAESGAAPAGGETEGGCRAGRRALRSHFLGHRPVGSRVVARVRKGSSEPGLVAADAAPSASKRQRRCAWPRSGSRCP